VQGNQTRLLPVSKRKDAEGDRVASIAVREDLGFGEGRAGFGALEVAGSG
jgi:hypothetical protein